MSTFKDCGCLFRDKSDRGGTMYCVPYGTDSVQMQACGKLHGKAYEVARVIGAVNSITWPIALVLAEHNLSGSDFKKLVEREEFVQLIEKESALIAEERCKRRLEELQECMKECEEEAEKIRKKLKKN